MRDRILSALNCILGRPTIAFVEFGEGSELNVNSRHAVIVSNKFQR